MDKEPSGIIYNIQRMSTKDGPGLRTTVFLKGCPLHCLWCSNPESQSFTPQLMVFKNLCQNCGRCELSCPYGAAINNGNAFGCDIVICKNCGICTTVCPTKARVISGKIMTVSDVMQVVSRDSLFYANSGGGVTFGGGEPTVAGDFILALLKASYKDGYHTCVDTCGMCPTDQFKKIMELTELFLFDCKHMDDEVHTRITGHGNSQILTNLLEVLKSKIPVRIRVPLIPGLNDSDDNIIKLAKLMNKYNKYEVDIMPYHNFGQNKYNALQRSLPTMQPYEPNELEAVLAKFTQHGLKAQLT